MRPILLAIVAAGCAASSARAPAAPPPMPSLADVIGRCDVGPPPKIDRCEAATELASAKTLDVDASPESTAEACDAGDDVACAWLGWTFEVDARDPERRAIADWRLRSAHGALDLGACEGWAARGCTGIDGGMSCCDRGIMPCPEGCAAACASAASSARARTLGVLEARCATGKALACHVAGMVLEYGSAANGVGAIVEPNPARALALFARACDGALGVACEAEAAALEASNAADARIDVLDRRACDLGAAAGCRGLAKRLEARGQSAAGARLDARACRLGMPLVCADLARAHSAAAAN